MARIAPLNKEDLGELSGLMDMVEAVMGFVPNSMLTMAHRPEILQAFVGLAAAINAPGTVGVELKRLIGEIASNASGCQYCVAHTSHQAHRSGISQEKLDDIWNFERSAHYSEEERAALLVAMKAAQVPNGVDDEDMTNLQKFFDDGQIVEIVNVISLFGFLNRWNATMATTLEGAPLSYASEALEQSGWTAGIHERT
jgi:uncharacterized peroxidase-related enzyme